MRTLPTSCAGAMPLHRDQGLHWAGRGTAPDGCSAPEAVGFVPGSLPVRVRRECVPDDSLLQGGERGGACSEVYGPSGKGSCCLRPPVPGYREHRLRDSGRRRHDRGGTCRRGRSCPLRQKRVLYEKPENGAGKSLSDQTVQEKSQEASIPSESRRKRTLRITRHDRKDGVREKERTNKGREQGRVRRKRCRLDLEKTDDASRQDSHGVSFPFSSKWSSAWYPAVRELTSFWLHPSPSARPGHPPFFSDSWDWNSGYQGRRWCAGG